MKETANNNNSLAFIPLVFLHSILFLFSSLKSLPRLPTAAWLEISDAAETTQLFVAVNTGHIPGTTRKSKTGEHCGHTKEEKSWKKLWQRTNLLVPIKR